MSCVTLPCKGIFINGCRILSYSRHCAWRLTPAVLHSKVLATGKIENIIPQFPPTCPAATAVIIRQTMPETEMIEIRTARLQIEDAIGDFVKNTQHTTCGRAGLGGGMEQIKFARKQILIIRERVSFLHGCTFFVSSNKVRETDRCIMNQPRCFGNDIIQTSQESRIFATRSRLFICRFI